jgi:hypothetical protein
VITDPVTWEPGKGSVPRLLFDINESTTPASNLVVFPFHLPQPSF